jgi:hypothetical protein
LLGWLRFLAGCRIGSRGGRKLGLWFAPGLRLGLDERLRLAAGLLVDEHRLGEADDLLGGVVWRLG